MSLTKIAVLASGNGSNFEAIVLKSRSGDLSAEVVGLIVNREQCGAIIRAERLGVASTTIVRAQFSTIQEWNEAIKKQLIEWQASWVVLAGFTGLIGAAILNEFPNRVVNSHPSLLPKFGGQGMFGDNVHAAVVSAREVETGITVHLLNERFDEGPVVAQKKIPVMPNDTPSTLAERVKQVEKKFYPAVLQDLLTGRIKSR